ncbi:MAG: DNA recombination protein RmuC [Candidatus Zambryskibacteria bacterium]|nr:DNA recombination protein RmuC [Candidatus Zambryskibacteria bacterium]
MDPTWLIIGLLGLILIVILAFGKSIIKLIVSSVLTDDRERNKDILDEKFKQGAQKLESEKNVIKTLIDDIKKQLESSNKKIEDTEKERIGEFQNLKSVIEQHKKITESLQISTNDLKKVLSNNQLRGNFGQEVAEDLLKMAGFVKGENYSSQEQQESGNKPDFTVFLPDKTKINIDVKFPFSALQRFQETDNREQQKQYLSQFKTDVKDKIRQITTRDYINPQENTVDFVIMFVPNEMIFSFIYEKFDDVWRDGVKNKVIMCGPFSFTAILRMVQQAYDNFKYQKDLHKIISHIKTFEVEYQKFSKALDSLGDKISGASKEYDKVSGVRDRQLTKIIDKINSSETISPNDADNVIENLALDKNKE